MTAEGLEHPSPYCALTGTTHWQECTLSSKAVTTPCFVAEHHDAGLVTPGPGRPGDSHHCDLDSQLGQQPPTIIIDTEIDWQAISSHSAHSPSQCVHIWCLAFF